MSAFSLDLENRTMDHILGGPDYTRLANVHLALFTSAPSESGGGVEVAGNGYARVQVANNSTNWPAAAGGVKINGAAFTFPVATGNWGTITHWAIMSAATGGSILFFGPLTSSKAISTSDSLSFGVGQISITLD
jgi:hypothetical protein